MAPPTTHSALPGSTSASETTSSDGFFGRASLLDTLDKTLRDAGAAVLWGPPGAGKTRLVREWIDRRRRANSSRKGSGRAETWLWVDLADTVDAAECRRRLGSVLDVDLTERLPKLAALLAERGVAGLVLDGAEALHRDPSLLAELRRAAPSHPLIVTSQRRLSSSGLSGLHVGGLGDADAVDLFRHHAHDDADDSMLVSLVRRLDGLPQPIELAARRTVVMSPQMLLERLERQLDLFDATTDPGGDSFVRAIQRAWSGLDDDEQEFVRQCSIFVDAFPLEAAEHVVRLPESSSRRSIIDLLGRLLNASWLAERARSSSHTRFGFWESLRVFARHRLGESGHAQAVTQRYTDYYQRLCAELSEQVETPDGIAAIERLRQERAHLLTVIDAGVRDRPDVTAEILWALRWNTRLEAEADDLAARLRRVGDALDETLEPDWGARIAMLRGELELRAGQSELASERLEQAYTWASSTGNRELEARVARASSMALAHLDVEAAEQRLLDALELTKAARDPLLEGRVRERLGYVHLQAFRLEDARQSFRRARQLLLTHGNALMAAEATSGLAYVAMRTGHRAAAASSFDEAVQIYSQTGDRHNEAEARFNWGVALLADGDLEGARGQFERALASWKVLGDGRYEAIARCRLGLVLAELDELAAAEREFGAAVAAGQRSGDWHNRAIAEACLVMLDHVRGGSARVVDLEHALKDMHFAGDPDAAAAALCVLAILSAARRQGAAAGEALGRLRAIQSLLSQQDVYLQRVVDALTKLAGRWAYEVLEAHGSEFVPQGVTRPPDEALLDFVPALFDDRELAVGQARRLINPYLRLLFRAYIELRAPAGASEGDVQRRLTAIAPDEARATLTLHEQAHWFQIDDEPPVDLMSRQPLRRILAALAASHLDDDPPGRSVDDLIEQGWPDEVLTRSAGANRVYTGIRLLRDMGLESILVTGDSGYRFSADVAVITSDRALDA